MLKLMPIPRVLHMKEIIPTSRRTNDCWGDISTGGPDVRNSRARCSNMSHGCKSHQQGHYWVAIASRMWV